MTEATPITDNPTDGAKDPPKSVQFKDGPVLGYLSTWHKALDSTGSDKAEGMHLANRGDRARLRRCRSIDDVLLTPSYYALREGLKSKGFDAQQHKDGDRRLATVVGLLSHIKENQTGADFAEQLATRRKDSQDAKLSGLRFRRLLTIDDRDKLFEKMIGVIRLLDGTLNVQDFAKDLYYWRPDSQCWVKKSWAQAYYSRLPDEP